jgi:hypothetical protein
MRASDLAAPTSSVRVPSADEPTVASRAHAFALALPSDTAFSHLTAARLLGPPTPRPWVPAESLWGLPEPELNIDLYAACGRWLARPDFVWRRQRVVGEYDGDQHRTDRSAWQYERERRAGLEDEGWSYVEMTSLSLVGARESRALRTRLTRLLLP